MNITLSDSDIAEIKTLWLSGTSIKNLSQKFGVNTYIVSCHTKEERALYKVMKKNTTNVWGGTRTKFSNEQIASMKSMRVKGYSGRYISKVLNISLDSVLRYTANSIKNQTINKILFPPYFKGSKRLKKCLTMAELKQVYEMYQADCNIQTISLYMRITKGYALECIEAAKWLYTGGLRQLQLHRKYTTPIPKIEPEKYFKDDDQQVYKRPPAIYTNTRLYDH